MIVSGGWGAGQAAVLASSASARRAGRHQRRQGGILAILGHGAALYRTAPGRPDVSSSSAGRGVLGYTAAAAVTSAGGHLAAPVLSGGGSVEVEEQLAERLPPLLLLHRPISRTRSLAWCGGGPPARLHTPRRRPAPRRTPRPAPHHTAPPGHHSHHPHRYTCTCTLLSTPPHPAPSTHSPLPGSVSPPSRMSPCSPPWFSSPGRIWRGV